MPVDMAAVVESFGRIVSAAVTDDVDDRDVTALELLLSAAARVAGLTESVHLAAARRLHHLADQTGQIDAEQVLIRSTRSLRKEASRTTRRASATAAVARRWDEVNGAVTRSRDRPWYAFGSTGE